MAEIKEYEKPYKHKNLKFQHILRVDNIRITVEYGKISNAEYKILPTYRLIETTTNLKLCRLTNI